MGRADIVLTHKAERSSFVNRTEEKPRLNGAFVGGRYWARTSDPQLVESDNRLALGRHVETTRALPGHFRLPPLTSLDTFRQMMLTRC
jgi:hypothetical protein